MIERQGFGPHLTWKILVALLKSFDRVSRSQMDGRSLLMAKSRSLALTEKQL